MLSCWNFKSKTRRTSVDSLPPPQSIMRFSERCVHACPQSQAIPAPRVHAITIVLSCVFSFHSLQNFKIWFCYHLLQKLQHAKAESDREIAALKRQVSDLERQLATVNKRRRLWTRGEYKKQFVYIIISAVDQHNALSCFGKQTLQWIPCNTQYSIHFTLDNLSVTSILTSFLRV